jgi:hypothetical protein
MPDPVENDLRHRFLASKRLGTRFIPNGGGKAVCRAITIKGCARYVKGSGRGDRLTRKGCCVVNLFGETGGNLLEFQRFNRWNFFG